MFGISNNSIIVALAEYMDLCVLGETMAYVQWRTPDLVGLHSSAEHTCYCRVLHGVAPIQTCIWDESTTVALARYCQFVML